MDEQESHNLANGQDPETREPEEFASNICFQCICLTLNLSTLHIVKLKKMHKIIGLYIKTLERVAY